MKVKMKDNGYSLRDVYNELWRGRDFEISHLWQRSVFLAVFMLAIAGAYGTYMMKVMFPENSGNKMIFGKLANESNAHGDYRNCKRASIDIKKSEVLTIELKANEEKGISEIEFITSVRFKKIVPIFLTYLGIVFSMMWIMMAKGSKRLYEEYEFSINEIIKNKEFNKNVDVNKVHCHGNLFHLEDEDRSDFILSPLAGDYSPSKINITIGIAALFCWMGFNILHIVDIAQMHLNNDLFAFSISVLLAILTYIFIYLILAVYCKTSKAGTI